MGILGFPIVVFERSWVSGDSVYLQTVLNDYFPQTTRVLYIVIFKGVAGARQVGRSEC